MFRVLCLGILGIAVCTSVTEAQKKLPVPGGPSTLGHSSVKFVDDANSRRYINVARDLIHDKDYDQAGEALQALLNKEKDYYVQVHEPDPADPKKVISRWASVKFEANNLLGAMPAKGLEAYEKKYGGEARKLFDAAVKKDDRETIADIAYRYRHTKAGAEAFAIHAKQFKSSLPVESIDVKDWRSWRGNLTNTGQANGGTPYLDKPLWKRPIMLDKLDGFPEADPDEAAQKHVLAAIKQTSDANQAVLSGFVPIACNDVLVYRTQRDVRAVALKEVVIKDDDSGLAIKVKPGQFLWKSIPMNRSLSLLLEKPNSRPTIEQWLNSYGQVPGFNSLLHENTHLGTLATDGKFAYALNDLGVPPHPGVFKLNQLVPNPFKPGNTKPLLMQNELYAYDLISGKLKWDLNQDDAEFKDSHFLGLPIEVGGKLYLLNEKLINPNAPAPNPFGGPANAIPGESELRLICLDPNKPLKVNSYIKPTILGPPLVLGNVVQENRFVQDIGRRVNTVQLAYSDGVLVCPTNAGEIFGIDLMTRTLAWSYSYRDTAPFFLVLPGMNEPLPGKTTTLLSKWKFSAPAIQAGKVVFTAPDADSIHCINLRDGKLAWKRARKKGDLYMAGVFDGKVVIVSETDIHALDLKDGNQLWAIATGDVPSGQGVASKGYYYLPLRKNEVLAVDLAKGIIKARNRGPEGAAAAGNLVIYGDMVLSQSPTEVVAYQQLAARLKELK